MNAAMVDQVRLALERCDERMRAQSLCASCGKPRDGVVFPEGKRRLLSSGELRRQFPLRARIGLCTCPEIAR
jgi:hypothetical protein